MADIVVTELDRGAVRRIARTARVKLGSQVEKGILVTGPEAQIHAVLQIVLSLLSEDVRDNQLIDTLLQDVEPAVMGPEHVVQLRKQAQAREGFLQGVVLIDAANVGHLLGSEAQNTSALARRLKREGKLFAITHRGVDLYPAAQIVDGEPSPAIPEILEAFPTGSPWTVALWLNAPSGWLNGEKPIDLLARDPDRVVRAAYKATEALRV